MSMVNVGKEEKDCREYSVGWLHFGHEGWVKRGFKGGEEFVCF